MNSASRMMAAISLGACGVSLAGGGGSVSRDSQPHAGAIAQLAAAFGGRRTEARISGGFAYAPCTASAGVGHRELSSEPDCGKALPASDAGRRALAVAVRRIERLAARQTSPAAQHALGVLQLINSGRESSAIAHLKAAAAASPTDASALNDLAAAYLVSAQRRDDPSNLVQALEAADLAVASNHPIPEAFFNRALILDRLCLHTAARAAWKEYLRLDGHTGWADEARQHLRALSAPAPEQTAERPLLIAAAAKNEAGALAEVVTGNPQAARELVEQDLLGEWAEAQAAARQSDADQALASARSISAALAARGEGLARDAIAAIDAARAGAALPRLRDLIAGHRAYRDGYALYKAFKPRQALARLDLARDLLRRGGSPFAFRAEFWGACCLNHLDRYGGSLGRLERIACSPAQALSPALAGHVAWEKALNQAMRGDVPSAVHLYSEALDSFSKAGETGNLRSLHGLLAAELDVLGRTREAWRHRYQALLGAAFQRDPRLRDQAYSVMAESMLLDGEPALALYSQNEALAVALATQQPEMAADAFFWRALIKDRLHRTEAALADLERAKRLADQQSDRAFRSRTLADISWVEGSLLAGSDPGRGTALLSTALVFYRAAHHHLHLMLAHLARARGYRKLRMTGAAEADLHAALDAYEALARGVAQPEQLLALFARDEDLFDEMISFQQEDLHRPDRAFTYSDRAHARVLPLATSGLPASGNERRRLLRTQGSPLALSRLRRSLPPGAALIQYSVQRDRLYTWVLRQQGLWSFSAPLASSRLEGLVRDLKAELDIRGETPPITASAERAAASLSDLLLRPWLEHLPPATDLLIFVPDKLLEQVPFACLRTPPRGGRYLIEKYKVEIVPSATAFAQANGRKRAGFAPDWRVLAVGDPAIDQSWSLPALPGGAAESAAVARLYGPATRLLRGREADKQSVLALAGGASTIHFAGHTIINSREPLLSALLLAPSPHGHDLGALTVREIYRLDLHHTKLVVLSSCEAVGGGGPANEGVTDLARAFLAAGVPVVVANLWRADDALTTELLTFFHRRLLAGEEPAAALRAAQLAMLHGASERTRSPQSWGGFEVIGEGIH